ncbi:MAG: hypothetical protein LN412_05500 [Candidatus Thermoplasmatota archaeon]|nr:hypothetical protein [Candidatus Thermoplasmatota archaeon]
MTEKKTATYVQKMPASWWLRNPRYLAYMLRELSSIFILVYILTFLVQILLLRDRNAYDAFLAIVESPFFVAFTAVAFAFAVYHGVTWWGLTSKVLQISFRGKTVPPALVLLGAIMMWAVVSFLVYLLLFRGV